MDALQNECTDPRVHSPSLQWVAPLFGSAFTALLSVDEENLGLVVHSLLLPCFCPNTGYKTHQRPWHQSMCISISVEQP
jgi:hypothetical protein